MRTVNEPPKRGPALFEQLFGRDQSIAFDLVSTGISAILKHASALLDEAGILAAARRYERAEFLIATAQEEMGKAYILADMCRVDLAKWEDVLRRLCGGFYDHVLKNVYFDLCAHRYPGIWELEHVQRCFRIGVQKWWPAPAESGEPDMPHDTYFLREANLYVDFDAFSGTWTVPHLPSKSMLFESPFVSPLTDARAALQKLQATHELGLFGANALRTFNQRLKTLSINEQTPTKELMALYDQVGKDLETTVGVAPSAFMDSELRKWPMYWIKPMDKR